MSIPVVDIFAGPGGLGEGFSAFVSGSRRKESPFRIAVSAEMEPNAARTLKLRAFFRQFAPGHAPQSYYDYVAGRAKEPWTTATKTEWHAACEEAQQLKLGEPEDDQRLHEKIRVIASKNQPWVLIGGPPCQAYSLVGRSRNRGTHGYKAEEDHRHFLYKHYLTILKKFQPAAFVMENVKGILSSKVGGELMFPKILDDLRAPGGKSGPHYQIVPLVIPATAQESEFDRRGYILRAEELGVPQARHRVVLLGVAKGIDASQGKRLTPREDRFTVADAIKGLPRLRSGLTDRVVGNWSEIAQHLLSATAQVSGDVEVEARLEKLAASVRKRDPGTGGKWAPKTKHSDSVPTHLQSWLVDPRLDGILNHECREHMSSDLMRYAFVSTFASLHGRSPKGANEFPKALYPKHKNWTKEDPPFGDRFKAQLWNAPSSTVTSHLSKDGHYFIHPDSSQLRSLSVREAARLQSFPDNYYFEGSRGAQFRQVGNAVPPFMAKQIAEVVHSILEG